MPRWSSTWTPPAIPSTPVGHRPSHALRRAAERRDKLAFNVRGGRRAIHDPPDAYRPMAWG
ncbi:MAG: hypothetical protein LZF60_340065 [Nitrospira sp.]|nr:MAG: hypothetical protein LZF60_340065 [Nitrospira sp.]